MARFDKMVKDGKIRRVGILGKEETRAMAEIKAEAVEVKPQSAEDDYSAYLDASLYESDAVSQL